MVGGADAGLVVLGLQKGHAQVVPDARIGVVRRVRRGRHRQVVGGAVVELEVVELEPEPGHHRGGHVGVGVGLAVGIDGGAETVDILLAVMRQQQHLAGALEVRLPVGLDRLLQGRDRLGPVLLVEVAAADAVPGLAGGRAARVLADQHFKGRDHRLGIALVHRDEAELQVGHLGGLGVRVLLDHALEVRHGLGQVLGFAVGQAAAGQGLGGELVAGVLGQELREGRDGLLRPAGFGEGPGLVELGAWLQLRRQLLDQHLLEGVRRLGVVGFVEGVIGADQTGEVEVLVLGAVGGMALDEGAGEIAEVAVVKQVEAVQLPVTGFESVVAAGIALLNHQVDLDRAGVALFHPVGVADQQQHLRPGVALGQDAGVAVEVVDDAVVIALGEQRLDDAHQRDRAVHRRRLRQGERALEPGHRGIGLAGFGLQHGAFDERFGEHLRILAGLDQLLKQRQRLRLLVGAEIDRAEHQQGGFAVRIVRLHRQHALQGRHLAGGVVEHLAGARLVVGGGQAHLRQRAPGLAEGELARGLGEVFGVEAHGAEPVGGRGRAIAVREAVDHLQVVALRHLQLVKLHVAFADAEQGQRHLAAGGIGLQVLAVGLGGQGEFAAVVDHRGVVEQVLVRRLRPRRGRRGLHRHRTGHGRRVVLHRDGARHLLRVQAAAAEQREEQEAGAEGAAHLSFSGLPFQDGGWRRRCSRCRPSDRCRARG